MFDGFSEVLLILVVVLMLFGSKEIPEIARFLGKTMAQLKNATNDIKSEIQKGAESNGFDTKSLLDLKENITSEISKAKDNLLGDTSQLTNITEDITSEINKAKDGLLGDTTTEISKVKETLEDVSGPIKRQM